MGTPYFWIGFNLFVLASIALDLGVFNRRLHKVSMREATFFSLLWVALSILFGVGILHTRVGRGLNYWFVDRKAC